MRHTLLKKRERRGRTANTLANIARRMTVVATGDLWQVEGVTDSEGNVERDEVEAFTGIGFYSRPAGRAEVVQLQIGAKGNHPVIVASRDVELLAKVAAALEGGFPEDYAGLFNSRALLHVRDGIVEARSLDGTAVSLATKADVEALAQWDSAHTHQDSVGGPTSPPVAAGSVQVVAVGPPIVYSQGTPSSAPMPAGTSVLRGE